MFTFFSCTTEQLTKDRCRHSNDLFVLCAVLVESWLSDNEPLFNFAFKPMIHTTTCCFGTQISQLQLEIYVSSYEDCRRQWSLAHLAFISQTVNKPRLQDPEGHCVKEQHATPSSLIKQEQNVLSSINQIKDFLDNNSGETNRLTAKRKKGFQKCPKKNVLTELHWHESPCSMCTSHFLSVTNSS